MSTAVRVIHQYEGSARSSDEFTAYSQAVRAAPGALEAEAYVSLADPQRVALLEMWADDAAYSRHWSSIVKDPAATDLVLAESLAGNPKAVPSEFYAHQYFNRDRVWVADTFKDTPPAIFWPAIGGVRIALQMSLVDTPELRDGFLADMRRTRLEPGCFHYEWYHGLDNPNYYLLLELWQDQFIYDNHWNMRIKVAASGQPREPAARDRGTNGIEFYRHQPFNHLYDRWLPADPHQWSETVVWPR